MHGDFVFERKEASNSKLVAKYVLNAEMGIGWNEDFSQMLPYTIGKGS